MQRCRGGTLFSRAESASIKETPETWHVGIGKACGVPPINLQYVPLQRAHRPPYWESSRHFPSQQWAQPDLLIHYHQQPSSSSACVAEAWENKRKDTIVLVCVAKAGAHKHMDKK